MTTPTDDQLDRALRNQGARSRHVTAPNAPISPPPPLPPPPPPPPPPSPSPPPPPPSPLPPPSPPPPLPPSLARQLDGDPRVAHPYPPPDGPPLTPLPPPSHHHSTIGLSTKPRTTPPRRRVTTTPRPRLAGLRPVPHYRQAGEDEAAADHGQAADHLRHPCFPVAAMGCR